MPNKPHSLHEAVAHMVASVTQSGDLAGLRAALRSADADKSGSITFDEARNSDYWLAICRNFEGNASQGYYCPEGVSVPPMAGYRMMLNESAQTAVVAYRDYRGEKPLGGIKHTLATHFAAAEVASVNAILDKNQLPRLDAQFLEQLMQYVDANYAAIGASHDQPPVFPRPGRAR